MTPQNYFEADESEAETCESDDSQEDPSFDIFEETRSRFPGLSIKKKSRTHVPVEVDEDEDENENQNVDCVEIVAPEFDASDQKSFEIVQKIIEDDKVEKLKVEQCKLYLRKHGLRLTGKKDILIHRIKEHISIMNGEGEHKYPASSFIMNCKGDASTGDVVMFEQNVYEMFNLASRSASGPPCGTRIVAGRIVKESYGAAKQQHTFTIEVLWSKGVKPLPPLHPLLIKGRNLYRLKTMRQRWENESERQNILSEKHSRGNAARSNRAARVHEKEIKKALRERTSKGNIQNQNQEKKRNTSLTRPKENINSNMLRSTVGWEPNGPSTNTIQAERNWEFYPSRPFQNSPQSHSFQQRNLPREVLQNLPQNHSFQQGHLPRKVQNLPQNHSFQLGHLPREVQNLPRNHSFQQGHLTREVQNLPQNRSFQQGHLPRVHYQGQRQQLCRYYPQGRCHYGTNCKYLH